MNDREDSVVSCDCAMSSVPVFVYEDPNRHHYGQNNQHVDCCESSERYIASLRCFIRPDQRLKTKKAEVDHLNHSVCKLVSVLLQDFGVLLIVK